VPKDIVVRGFIIDSETGALEEIKYHNSKQDLWTEEILSRKQQ
jgi:hypothetical protein